MTKFIKIVCAWAFAFALAYTSGSFAVQAAHAETALPVASVLEILGRITWFQEQLALIQGQLTPPVSATPSLMSIAPGLGPVGTEVILSGKGFLPEGNTVYFGQGAISDLASPDQKTITFFVPATLSPKCAAADPPCVTPEIKVTPGDYRVLVNNKSGTSNAVTFRVTPTPAPLSVTVRTSSSTPTGAVAAGQSKATLARFIVYAGGEDVRIKWLGWGLNLTNTSSTPSLPSIDSQVKNVSLIDSAGNQIAATVGALSTPTTCTDTAYSSSTTAYRNCFGNSFSPINFVVPANYTHVLSLVADIQPTAAFGTITAILTGNTLNAQGLVSNRTASTGPASGNALMLPILTVMQNPNVGTITLAPGSVDKRIGSYVLSVSLSEDVKVSTVTILTGAAGAQFRNLKVKLIGVQFGSTQTVLANSTAYTFSGTPFMVPKGKGIILDVYGDVLLSATAGTKTAITTFSGCTANGAISLAAIPCAPVKGQNVVIAIPLPPEPTAPGGLTPTRIKELRAQLESARILLESLRARIRW